MVRITGLVDHGYAVQDLVHCAECDNPMHFNGNEFICPGNESAVTGGCQTPATDADTLLRNVMGCLIGRLMTPRVTQALVDSLDQEIIEESETLDNQYRDKYEELRSLETRRNWLEKISPREEEEKRQLLPRIDKVEMETQSLYEQTGLVPFIRHPDRMKARAQDPQTYLDDAQPADTRELIGTFVEDIRVGAKSVELVYIDPLPDEENGLSVTSEHIELL